MMDLVRRFSTRENSILLLTLTVVACLPISLRKTIPDAASSLLLPVTILAALLAFGLASADIRKTWAGLLLIAGGPILLFIRIARVGSALSGIIWETLRVAGRITMTAQGQPQSVLDFHPWLSAGGLFTTQAGAFGHRLVLWAAATAQNQSIGDTAARAFVWSFGLWLIAAWASWQIRRQGKVLAGLLPAIILLGLILNNTAPKSGILWLFLIAFMLLLGITHYQSLVAPWIRQGTDFSDSIWEDSLIMTLSLGAVVLLAAYTVSTFSLKEMLDRMRERQTVTVSSSASSSSPHISTTQLQATLPESHAILGGPTLTDDVVMLVSTGDFPPMPHAVNMAVPRYYWRTMTYQTYIGSGWINRSSIEEDVAPHHMLVQTTPLNYRIVHQEITFPEGVTGGLYWTGALVQSDTPLQIAWRSQPLKDPAAAGFDPLAGGDVIGGLISGRPAGASGGYTIESILPKVSEADLEAAPAVYPAWIGQRYLALPDTVPERVRSLARDLTANAATPYDRALAIETYLRKFPYSLKVPAPPLNQDAADYFLFDLKKGYCDYYATAMTVLARAADLPARLVIGYASGGYDSYDAQYVIRQTDSHAWTEIYFSGIGWIEFEPTAGQPTPVRAGTSQPAPTLVPGFQSQTIWGQLPSLFTARFNFPWQIFTVVIILYLLWIGSDGLRLSRYAPPEAILRLIQRLRRLARSISGLPPPDQTIREYTAALTGRLESLQNRNRLSNWLLSPVQAQIGSLTDLYTRSLFSPIPLTRADTRHAAIIWGRLRWRLFLLKLILVLRPGSARP